MALKSPQQALLTSHPPLGVPLNDSPERADWPERADFEGAF